MKQGGSHSREIDIWIRKNADGLSADQLLLLFVDGLGAIHERAAKTLSHVTLGAIFDRVLHESRKEHPLLNAVNLNENSFDFGALIAQSGTLDCNEIQTAFRHLLIGLITLLGNLTANILTRPLYQELHKVTADQKRSRSSDEVQILRNVKKGSYRGDK